MSAREQPRYRQVAGELRAEIVAGTFGAGAALPTEMALCDRYGISRHTAREALRLLIEDGLIERRQGAGSIVADRSAPTFASPTGDFESILQYARDAKFHLCSSSTADAQTLRDLDLSGAYRVFTGLRRIGRQPPIALSTIAIDAEFAPDDTIIDQLESSVSEWIEQTHSVNIEAVEQRMDAIALSTTAASALEVAPDTPALRTIRHSSDAAGKVVLASQNLHPAGRFAYTMTMKRKR